MVSTELQNYMKKHGITQRKLAKKISMAQPNLNSILNRKYHPRIDTLERIAAGMEIEVSTLIRLMKEEQS